MKAMIFAAGLGTRLRPLTDTRPKALVEVGGHPLIWHVIRRLQAAGADAFVVNVHHLPEQIIDYIQSQDWGGARFDFSIEMERPLETGGGIRRAASLLRGSGHFLVHNVDILSDADLSALVSHARPEALATLLVSERQTSRYLLFDDAMRLVGWTNTATGEVRSPFPDLEPERCRRFAFSGIHYLSEEILPLMEGEPDCFPIMDFYLRMAAQHPIYGMAPAGLRLLDVGKIDSLATAEAFLKTL